MFTRRGVSQDPNPQHNTAHCGAEKTVTSGIKREIGRISCNKSRPILSKTKTNSCMYSSTAMSTVSKRIRNTVYKISYGDTFHFCVSILISPRGRNKVSPEVSCV